MVLHGEDDPLVPIAGGRDTAASIAGAELRTIPGMGHDLPPALYDIFVEAICGRSNARMSPSTTGAIAMADDAPKFITRLEPAGRVHPHPRRGLELQ